MTEALGVLSYLLLPLIGAGVLRLKAVQRMALDGRIGIATATGALIVAVVMSLMSLVGLQWTTTRLVSIFAVIAMLNLAWIPHIGSTVPQTAHFCRRFSPCVSRPSPRMTARRGRRQQRKPFR